MSKRIGKNVSGVQYIHRSLINELTDEDWDVFVIPATEAIEKHLGTTRYPLVLDWSVMSIDRNNMTVSFVECPRWDVDFEPAIGNRITFKHNYIGEPPTVKFTRATLNPQIFHRRHLFVSDDYTGFSLKDDKARVDEWEALNPDKTRMGRLNWWLDFCRKHNMTD